MQLPRLCFYGALVLILQSCGSLPSRDSGSGVTAHQGTASVLQDIGNAESGTRVEVTDSQALITNSVVVGSEYFAASGRVCKRLSSDMAVEAQSIICRDERGSWYLPRRLMSNTIDSSSLTSAYRETVKKSVLRRSPKRVTQISSTTAARYSLQPGETLWSFSKRTTGDARNWEAIAQANQIKDAKSLEAGTSLVIPRSLLLPGS